MNELLIDEKNIRDKIYVIRGKQVMLDRDLAELYECKNGTKTINQAVDRHLDKFPEDFYFQLTKKEFDNLKSQFGTSSWNDYGGVRKLPYADLNMLDMIRNINCNIILITSSKTFLSEKEINKFNKQYNKLKVYKNNKFHDRYFILDKNIMYHCGTSINYAGKRMFSINLLEDKFMKNNLFNFVKSII